MKDTAYTVLSTLRSMDDSQEKVLDKLMAQWYNGEQLKLDDK